MLSISGISFLRYAVYTSPIWLFFVWLLLKGPKISYNKDLTPFYLLVFFSFLTSAFYGVYSFKQTFFLFVFVFAFTIFDFSKLKINEPFLVLIFLFAFLLQIFASGVFGGEINYSFSRSQSSWESTFSFSFGMLAVFFLLTRRWFYFFFSVFLTFLSFKRAAIFSIFIPFIIVLLPEKIKTIITKPYIVMPVTAFSVYILIQFSYSQYDELIFDLTGESANAFSQGRQYIWNTLLNGIKYNFYDFFFLGLGGGASISTLADFHKQKILVHNDLLMLYIDYGFVFLCAFVFFLVKHNKVQKRIFSISLLVVFLTDNVIIYQHVMILYLILQNQLTRITENRMGLDK
jgi:hypothetical protein